MAKLIDDEKLLAVIEEHCYTLRDHIKQAINEQPIVDIERHAHWIAVGVIGDDFAYVDCECSACGYTDCFDCESGAYNYCPDCGCKMDEV